MHLIICIFLLDEFTCFMCVGLYARYKVLIAKAVFSNHTCKRNSGLNGLLAGKTKDRLRKTKEFINLSFGNKEHTCMINNYSFE